MKTSFIKQRQTNIELLRIILTIGVIILHYCNSGLGGGIAYAKGINLYILYFISSMFVCAVDLFVLITGYFMCKTNKILILKPIELIVQVIVFQEAVYFLSVIAGKKDLTLRHFIGRMVPANYFVILYVALYFISPFLNLLIEKVMEMQIAGKFVWILLLVFAAYPTIVDVFQEIIGEEYAGLSTIGAYGSQWGYTIVNFVLLYILGACIRMRENIGNEKKRYIICKILVSAILLVLWAVINDKTGYGTERSAWEYCNPLVIFMAVESFILFEKINIGVNKIINELAKGSFTVYLLHINFLKYINIKQYVTGSPFKMILHIFVCTVMIYFTCWCIYEVYAHISKPIYDAICNKATILKKNII